MRKRKVVMIISDDNELAGVVSEEEYNPLLAEDIKKFLGDEGINVESIEISKEVI